LSFHSWIPFPGVAKHRAGTPIRPALAPERDICYVGTGLRRVGGTERSRDARTAGLERGMLKRLHAAAHVFNGKVGFSRFGVALSLTIIVIAAVVLYHVLRDIDPDELVDALEATDWRALGVAGLFVAAGYLTLTLYDLFALRTIGRAEVPYRIAALASFTSYAVGHNVGASVFSGGAVRYRIYSAWGLSVIEVTKICFVAGLTFWLGNATVLGLGVLHAPQQASDIDQLPLWLNRVLALMTLAALTAYVAWVWVKPRVIGREGWQVALPGGPLTLVQIAIGILDLACCALAMYWLVPDEPHLGFIPVAVIFVAATLLGFASHAPGGLGVFDATMMVALWQFDKEDLLAGLLLFRLLYYIIPFLLSLAILGTREALLGRATRRLAPPLTVPMPAVRGLMQEKSDVT
jgi:glycosyltransferase 2 family protein